MSSIIRFFRNMRLGYKLNAAILTVVLLIFSLMLFYNYSISRRYILRSVQENTRNLTSSAINKSEVFFRVIEKIAQNMSFTIRNAKKSETELRMILSDIVQNNSEIYGSCIAYAPYQFHKDLQLYAPYCYRKGDALCFENLANPAYNYPDWEWYSLPTRYGKAMWSEPYFDEGGGNELMATYSVPFYRTTNEPDSLRGVITADVSLHWLQKIMMQINIFETGYAFLISPKGTILAHPDSSLIMKESIFSLAEKLEDPLLDQVGREMIAGKEGFVPVKAGNHKGRQWIYFTPLKSNGWSLAFIFPEDELYADLHRLNRMLIFFASAGLFLLLILILAISNRITKPLRRLAAVSEGFGRGSFDADIPPSRTEDEVGKLNKSFVKMQEALKVYISNLKVTTAAKEKIESEVKIARDIQMGMIPHRFPAFPGRRDVDLHGFIEPARDVGGDLYDFFFVDQDQLCFAIGDVAGKGIPAALFMAMTKTILRTGVVQQGIPLKSVLESINTYLCQNNERNLFVTLFLGLLDTRTGHVEYVNAGHNYPFVIPFEGKITELEQRGSIPLGIDPGASYPQHSIELDPGTTLLLYTDGVSEAFDTTLNPYTIPRLQTVLGQGARENPKDMVGHLVTDLRNFTAGAEQSDDIAILAVQYRGRTQDGHELCQFSITILNDLGELQRVEEAIRDLGHEWSVPADCCSKLNLVVEELVHNIISYGYQDAGTHEIMIVFRKDGAVVFAEITDDAIPFNPVQFATADTKSGIEDRKVGGLGIHLVRNLTERFEYRRENNLNITTVTIRN